MKKIISLAIFFAPMSAFACGGGLLPAGIFWEISRNIILWVSLITFLGSVLTAMVYAVLYLIRRDKRKTKIIFVSLIIAAISIFIFLILFASARMLCASSPQF
jgi:hypothetical protein